jgi:hypothetical protein
VKLFLVTVHVVLAGGVLLGVSRRPDAVTAPAAILLLILAATCTGLWLEKRWAAASAGALGIGAAGTAVMLLMGRAGWSGTLATRVALALFAVAIVEFATIAFALRRGSGGKEKGAA